VSGRSEKGATGVGPIRLARMVKEMVGYRFGDTCHDPIRFMRMVKKIETAVISAPR